MFTYLILDLLTLFFPLAFSFEKNIRFYKKWKYALPAIIITALYFLAWDFYFTSAGIWRFNAAYLTKIYVGNLPLEEALFFICIPYACLFIYAVLKDHTMKNKRNHSLDLLVIILIALLFITGILNYNRIYTSVTFISLSILFAVLIFYCRVNYLFHFFTMYLIQLIPFFIINGLLTALPVVSYNNEFNLNIRIATIPLEDTVYSMLMLLMNVAIYEGLQPTKKQSIE